VSAAAALAWGRRTGIDVASWAGAEFGVAGRSSDTEFTATSLAGAMLGSWSARAGAQPTTTAMYDDRARRTIPFMASSATGQQLHRRRRSATGKRYPLGSPVEVSCVTQTAQLA